MFTFCFFFECEVCISDPDQFVFKSLVFQSMYQKCKNVYTYVDKNLLKKYLLKSHVQISRTVHGNVENMISCSLVWSTSIVNGTSKIFFFIKRPNYVDWFILKLWTKKLLFNKLKVPFSPLVFTCKKVGSLEKKT